MVTFIVKPAAIGVVDAVLFQAGSADSFYRRQNGGEPVIAL
jgi:hypothetical protein